MSLKHLMLAAALPLLIISGATARDMDPGAGNNGVSNPGGGYGSRGGEGGGGWFQDLTKGQLKQLERDFKQREKNKQSQQGGAGKSYNQKQQQRERNGWSKF